MGGVIEHEGQQTDVLGQPVRPFGPLKTNHPLLEPEQRCPACGQRFTTGEITCLLVMDSEENRRAAGEARGAYNAVATPAHWTCVTGSDDPSGDYRRYFGSRLAESGSEKGGP